MASVSGTIDNIQGHWKFNSDLTDESANGNDLTHSGTATYATGALDNGLDLENTASEYAYITDATQTGLDIIGDLSFSVWVKLESLPGAQSPVEYTIFSKDDVTNRSYYVMIDANEKLVVFCHDGTNVTRFRTNAAVVSGTSSFTHIVGTVDISSPSCVVYVDGSSVAVTTEASAATSIANTSAQFEVGRYGQGNRYFDGIIDELTITSDIITSGEVTTLYNSGTPLPWSEAGGGTAFSQSVVIV